MDPFSPHSTVTRCSYVVGGAVVLFALAITFDGLSQDLGAFFTLFAGFFLALPGLLLGLLVWQVSTAERVHLPELVVTALTAVGQAIMGLAFMGTFVTGSGNGLALFYGLANVAAGAALGFYTFHAAAARNRALRGTAA